MVGGFVAQELIGGTPPQTSALDLLADGNASARSAGTDSNARLGTARWMTPEETLRTVTFDDSGLLRNSAGLWEGASQGQIWLGLEARTGAPLAYGDDRHVTVICGSRGGKGAGIIVPNLCLWPGSCIVIDPKGENANITARRRGSGSEFTYGMGQKVCILDPYGTVQLADQLKGRFNPLAEIDIKGPNAVVDAGVIASSIVEMASSENSFWEESARNLVKVLVLHVLTAAHFEGRRNLVSVYKLITQGDWIAHEYVQRQAAPQEDQKRLPSAIDLLWRGMEANKAFEGLIAGVGAKFAKMNDKTRDGITAHVTAAVAFMEDPVMHRVLETSDFKLEELKTEKRGLTLYLSLPQNAMETHYKWLRIIINLATAVLQRTQGIGATGQRTLFVLDEFAGLKRMNAIEHGAAQAAGSGIKFMFILQNLPQLQDIYEKSWETFLDNSGLRIFFQVDGETTGDYLVGRLGETEVWRESQSDSQASTFGYTTTDGETDTEGLTTTDGTTYTDGVTRTEGQTTTRGTTDTLGTTDTTGLTSTSGFTRTLGSSDTMGASRSWGGSRSSTRGDTLAITDGTNEGTGGSMTQGGPTSGSIFGLRDDDANSWSEANSFNRGTSHSRSLSRSDSISDSRTWTDGSSSSRALSTSDANSMSRAQSSSTARSRSQAQSQSLADSMSEALSKSEARSRSTAKSVSRAITKSTAKSLSDTQTQGRAESVHKRSLLNVDEAARLLARVDDRRSSAYPGRVVALISGRHPLLLRRINYFESAAFAGLFDPNPEHAPPKHPALPALTERFRRRALLTMIHNLGAAKEREEMDARSVREDAQREAAEIITAARIEVDTLLSAARSKSGKDLLEAQQKVDLILKRANAEAKDILSGAVEQRKRGVLTAEAQAARDRIIDAKATKDAILTTIFTMGIILTTIALIASVGAFFYFEGQVKEYAKYVMIGAGSLLALTIFYGFVGDLYKSSKSVSRSRLVAEMEKSTKRKSRSLPPVIQLKALDQASDLVE